MALTDTTLRTAKPKSKQYKMYDADGLFILIMPNGGKWWRLKYRMDGKEKNISLGTYPEISLKNARAKRDEAKALVAQGIDPSIQRQAAKAATLAENVNAYEVVAREWFSQQATQWTEDYYQKKLALHEKSIFPFLGARPIAQITAPELLGVMRRIEARGAIETAHRALGDCGCIFRYAIATSRAERDTAADLKGALKPFKNKPFASIKTPAQVGELLRAIDETHGNRVSIVVRAALQLMPLVFVRSKELCRAEWKDFNLQDAEWRIPAEKMKQTALPTMHIVPLSRQALEILKELAPYTNTSRYVFQSPQKKDAPITGETLLAALKRLGFEGKMTVHGFRSMASTLLNEKGYDKDWIERQLHHCERNKIRAAYNFAEYMPFRRRMMQEWADYLDTLREQSGKK